MKKDPNIRYGGIQPLKIWSKNRISLTLIFTFLLTICFGQTEITGTWTLNSYIIGSRKVIEVKDKSENKITFNRQGRYRKTYHAPAIPDVASLHMECSLLGGNTTYTYFDKDGNELKGVRIRKMTERGTFDKSDTSGVIRFLTEKNSYSKTFKIEQQFLLIADTLDKGVIWSRYKKKA